MMTIFYTYLQIKLRTISLEKKKKETERDTGQQKPGQHARTPWPSGQIHLKATHQYSAIKQIARVPRLLSSFLFSADTWGPLPRRITIKLQDTNRRVDCVRFQFLAFHPGLILGDLSHHLTSRLFLLKLHTLLFISPQTTQTESLQAARIWPRNSAVLPQYIVEFGELSPRFDL
jgi:hypothetical protein